MNKQQMIDPSDSCDHWLTDGVSDAALCSVPARFAEIVRSVPPEHPAYVGADGSMTYAELDHWSDRLACAILEAIGYSGGQKAIALLLPHTAASVVGIFGALKTGHFFVPLAPEHGVNHHIQILADCPPAALVTTTALLSHAQAILAGGSDLPVFLVDALLESAFVLPFPAAISSQAYAMVIYTSGTTGRPRGVLRTHGQTTAYAVASNVDLGLTAMSRVAYFLSYAFASIQGFIRGILHGATLCAFAMRKDTLAGLYGFIVRERVTHMSVAIAMLRELSGLADTNPLFESMRFVTIGGETISRQDIAAAARLLPHGCRLMCALGATEVIEAARLFIDMGASRVDESAVVGYTPAPLAQITIVNEDGQPVDPGCEGEIAVRSPYVTPGYWNQPELNARRFLPDPEGGDRHIFLTGDRGRMTSNGLLEHLGRIDFMVKVRGYRVEPNTIEVALLTHASVAEVVVVARPSLDGSNRLIAYIVARQTPVPTVSELRRWLAQTLPEYMIPVRFVFLEHLPRKLNHKVDRQALPAPGANRPLLETPFVASRTEVEEQLAGIWAALLGLDEVGVEDSFFELGGDSILGLRMAVDVERTIGRGVPPVFFRMPTIAHLAAVMTDGPSPAIRVDEPVACAAASGEGVHPGRFVPYRIARRFMRSGPVWYGHGVPYRMGIRIQRWLCSTRIIRQHLFAHECAVFRTWVEATHQMNDEPVLLLRHLMANTWRHWRLAALRTPELWQRTVAISGADVLDRSQRQGRGVVLVFPHYADSAWIMRIVHHFETEIYALHGAGRHTISEQRARLHTERLVAANTTLGRGGVVLIAIDSTQGRRGIEVPFYGFTMPFRSGAAELALTAGADMVFATWVLEVDGRMKIDFRRVSGGQEGDQEHTVADLVTRYAQVMTAAWPTVLPSISFDVLRSKMVSLRRRAAEGESRSPASTRDPGRTDSASRIQ